VFDGASWSALLTVQGIPANVSPFVLHNTGNERRDGGHPSTPRELGIIPLNLDMSVESKKTNLIDNSGDDRLMLLNVRLGVINEFLCHNYSYRGLDVNEA
jgi:hypothetical protein